MFKKLALIMGALFVLGTFLSLSSWALSADKHLFGLFTVSWGRSFTVLALGIMGLLTGFYSQFLSLLYLRFVGIFLSLLGLASLYFSEEMLYGLICPHTADIVGYFVLAIIALLFGFCCPYNKWRE